MPIKMSFAFKDNKIVNIKNVKAGLECNCFCPHCNSSLIARKGKIKRHHFAHYNKDDCLNGGETIIHLMAKEILEKERKIMLPPITLKLIQGGYYETFIIRDKEEVEFDEIIVEKRFNEIIPDIIAIKNNKKLFIEIKITHGINKEKLEKIKSENISLLEINLAGLELTPDYKDLLNCINIHGEWKYNTYLNKVKELWKSACDESFKYDSCKKFIIERSTIKRFFSNKRYYCMNNQKRCEYYFSIDGQQFCGYKNKIKDYDSLKSLLSRKRLIKKGI